MKIYITTNEFGVIEQWGSTRGAVTDIEIEVEEGSKVLLSPSNFKYVNGEIVERTPEEFENSIPKPTPTFEELQQENTFLKERLTYAEDAILFLMDTR